MNPFDIRALRHTLSFAYRLMVASAPLLRFAIERCDGRLEAYYFEHLKEEVGHDEMLRGDLLELGLTEIPVFHRAAQIAGSQYYLIAHDHPAMLLGYMHALERESLTLEQVDAIAGHHGKPLTALRHHSEHDPLHKLDLEREIEALDPELREKVLWNERSVIEAIESALKEQR